MNEDVDYDNDQSILKATQAVPVANSSAITLLHVFPGDLGEITHGAMAREQFKEIAGKWCDAVRATLKDRQANKEAQQRIAGRAAREAAEAGGGSKIIMPPGVQMPQSIADMEKMLGEMKQLALQKAQREIEAKAAQDAADNAVRPVEPRPDPTEFARSQWEYWKGKYEELKEAEANALKWGKIVNELE